MGLGVKHRQNMKFSGNWYLQGTWDFWDIDRMPLDGSKMAIRSFHMKIFIWVNYGQSRKSYPNGLNSGQ